MEQFAAGVRDREIIFPNESGAYDLSSNYRLPPAIVDELTEELFPTGRTAPTRLILG